MKVAIIHDSFLHFGGAESVFFDLVEKYPEADIFIPLITNYFLEMIRKKTGGEVKRSWLSNLPFLKKISSLFKPLLIIYWETLDLKGYDLIISSSHSFSSKSVNKAKDTKHISYIHTPPKYLYEEYNQMNWIKKFPFNFLFWPIIALLRKYDFYSAQKPDILITNSKNVQARIKKYYKRKSRVIYPPVAKPVKGYKKKPGKYFLFFSRLERQKGVELVVKTCAKYNIPLVVVGTGSQEKYLKRIAGRTIFFTGFIDEAQKSRIFAQSKALIYASIDEDYGIAAAEATTHKVPIIGFDSGAIREIADEKNSVLFSTYSISALKQAIDKFNQGHYD